MHDDLKRAAKLIQSALMKMQSQIDYDRVAYIVLDNICTIILNIESRLR